MHDKASGSQNRTNFQTRFMNAAEVIRADIQACNTVSFARFMELALYCPDYGFYDKESDTVGHRGHFYTSVSVGRLFGELLAYQFTEWFEALDLRPSHFSLIEAGAHDGRLAADILGWLRQHQPSLFDRLEYTIIEPSKRRQEWQGRTLAEFTPRIRWMQKLSGTPRFTGIFFSNELLDSMPVHRYGWDAKKREWFEWGVTADQNRFTWVRLSKSCSASRLSLPMTSDLLEILPDGYTIEKSPAAALWWKSAANALERGKLLTFDYGHAQNECLAPERPNGTLRAYYRHRIADDILANAGEQDVTAHVNFTEIQSAGEAAGLQTERCQSQAKFLTEVASRAWKTGSGFGDWLPEQSRQFQTLTHPDHLGRAFQVLIQSR